MHRIIETVSIALLWAGTFGGRRSTPPCARQREPWTPWSIRPRDIVFGHGLLGSADVMVLLREYDRSGRGANAEEECLLQ